MWGNVLGMANAHPTGQGFYGAHYPRQAVAPQAPARAAVQAPAVGGNPLLAFQQSPFVFHAEPAKDLSSGGQKADVPWPPPPPPAINPWQNAGGEKKVDNFQHSFQPTGMQAEPDGEPLPKTEADIDRVLARAVIDRNANVLRHVLDEACRLGMHGSAVREARDMLLTLESQESKDEAGRLVDEAIESDDWWKMQGALQRAHASDLPKVKIDGLKDAMLLHTRRKEAATGLRKAVENGDTEALRIAIEKALTGHVRQKDVDRARDALKELEFRKAEARRLEQARTKFEMQLREAAATKSTATLLAVIQAAENGSNADARSLRSDVREKAISAARAELRTQALDNLRDLHEACDIEGLSAALKEAPELGVKDAELENFSERLQNLRKVHHHRKQLRTAVKDGGRNRLQTIVAEAEAAGLADDEDLIEAKVALEKVQEQEKVAEEKARALKKVAEERAQAERLAQEKRDEAAKELQFAFYAEDPVQLSAAINLAIEAGIGGVEVAPAEEKLRFLRGKAGASAQLLEAIESQDVYKLRAAIAAARGSMVDEKMLSQAKTALNRLTGQADARRGLASAMSSGHAETLLRAIEEARARGLPRNEIAEAEVALRSAKHTDVGGELRAAMESEDVALLRKAVGSAVDAGMNGQQLESAWDRIRLLENRDWALRELKNAVASGDTARLQVAISHAEQAKVGKDELVAARKEFDAWVSKRQAQQQLQLARASGSAETLRAALRTAKASGLQGAIVNTAETELLALRRGGAWRPPPPAMKPPPPPCGDDSTDAEDESCAEENSDQEVAVERTYPRPPTDPQLHSLDIHPSSKRVSWAITSESSPVVPASSVSTAPLTDPQMHAFPAPPRAW